MDDGREGVGELADVATEGGQVGRRRSLLGGYGLETHLEVSDALRQGGLAGKDVGYTACKFVHLDAEVVVGSLEGHESLISSVRDAADSTIGGGLIIAANVFDVDLRWLTSKLR